MSKLSGKQRRNLRGQAHALEPIARIGKDGVTDAVCAAVTRSLADHELIKIKFVDLKDEKKPLSAELAERTDAERVGLIGNVAILYRRQEDPEKRSVNPDAGPGA